MRSLVLLSIIAIGCGGPIGVPLPATLDDTAPPQLEPRHGAVIGLVLDSGGAGILGAHVVSVPRGHEASTDADGAFELPWLGAGDYELVVCAEGYQPLVYGPVAVDLGDPATTELTLEPLALGGLVVVTVLGPGDVPVEGALVTLSSGASAVADAAGVAQLEGITGQDLTLVAAHPDGDLWPRTLVGVDVEAAAGVQWQVELSGRPPADASLTGATTCLYCHPEQAEAHGATAHARAHVEDPSAALLTAFEQGLVLDLDTANATLWLDGDQPTVTLVDADGVTISHAVVSYLGDPEHRSVPVVTVGEQVYPLPLAWHAPGDERPGYPDSEARLVAFELDRWFDRDGAFVFGGEGPDPLHSAEATCLPCHSSGYSFARRDDGGADLSYARDDLRYAGVGCEACHGPSGGHTSSSDPATITDPSALDSARADETCGQCHARTVGVESGLPHPYAEAQRFQPGDVLADFADVAGDRWPSGLAAQSRMQLDEHRDALHGQAGLRCIDCHGAHEPMELDGSNSRLLRLTADDNALCEACHMGGFADSEAVALEHMAHRLYQPDGNQEGARCTGCHMPATASDGFWSEESGAGELSSHSFVAASPAATLELFDAAGVSTLELGAFPAHACSDCHAWNAWYFDSLGLEFDAPFGDPTLASTHEAFLTSWQELYP